MGWRSSMSKGNHNVWNHMLRKGEGMLHHELKALLHNRR